MHAQQMKKHINIYIYPKNVKVCMAERTMYKDFRHTLAKEKHAAEQ